MRVNVVRARAEAEQEREREQRVAFLPWLNGQKDMMLLLPSLLPLPLPLPLLIAAIDDIGENMLTATPISWFYGRTCLRHRQRHKGPGNSFGPFPGCPPLGLQCTNLSAPCTLLRPSESPRMSGRPPCWVPSGAGPAAGPLPLGSSSSEGTRSSPGGEGGPRLAEALAPPCSRIVAFWPLGRCPAFLLIRVCRAPAAQ